MNHLASPPRSPYVWAFATSLLLALVLLIASIWPSAEPKQASDAPPTAQQTNKPRKLSTEEINKSFAQKTFNTVYQRADWGKNKQGQGHSGAGSTAEVTQRYREFLEQFIKKHKIRSVVDAGCGDWEFSKLVDWQGVDYLGIDISDRVVNRLIRLHQKENIRFRAGDVTEKLPSADLLIIKDVLQHLPNLWIQRFIKNNLQKGRYRYAIITNDRAPKKHKNNKDIYVGSYREMDLSLPPFSLKGLKDVMNFKAFPSKVVQVLRLEDDPIDSKPNTRAK